jgi:hypothetical protein
VDYTEAEQYACKANTELNSDVSIDWKAACSVFFNMTPCPCILTV